MKISMGSRLTAALTLVVLTVAGAGVAPPASAAPTAAQIRAGQWWLGTMDISRAWSVTRGAGVTVGVVDTGIERSHPDLSGAVVGGTDVSGRGTPAGGPVDDDPHGTNMAGYIAGRGHGAGNRLGLIGAAPQARLLSVSAGSGTTDLLPAGQGIRWAVDHGAKVINVSLTGQTADDQAAVAYAEAHDVVVVAGAGNGGLIDGFPSYFGVVGVSGIDANAQLDPSSSTGGPRTNSIPASGAKLTDTGAGVTVSAPFSTTAVRSGVGGDLPSLTLTSLGSYTLTGGTSNATAIVSGIVALIRAKFPSMNAANVVNRLIRTTNRPAGFTYDGKHGFGIPDAYRALTADVPTVCENPLGQVGKSFGIWKSILLKTTYTPACAGGSSSSTSPSSNSSSSAPASSGSTPADPATSAPAQATSSSGSSTPSWVWVLIALVVLAAAALAFVVLRRRGGRGGPGGGGGYSPPGGGYPPPGGGYPPPGYTGPPPNSGPPPPGPGPSYGGGQH